MGWFVTDRAGLDPARYAANIGQVGEKQFFTFESQISDKERFKDVDPLTLRCPSCQGTFIFEGLLDDTVSLPLRYLTDSDDLGKRHQAYRDHLPSLFHDGPYPFFGCPT